MPQDREEFVRRWWAAFNQDGLAPLWLCDEDIEMTNPAEFPVQGPYIGHEGVRQWTKECWEVFSDLRMEVEEVVDAGDGETVVSVQTVRGKMRHSKLPADVQWAAVWTIRGGKAVRARGYLTRAEALEAAGVQE